MSSNLVLLETTGGVATVTLNHPSTLNAISVSMASRLREVVDTVKHDPDIKAAILTGAGTAFCSGANLAGESGAELTAGGAGFREKVHFLNEILVDIAEMRKPWLAAVNGPAVGGGCSLALVCDLALSAESAYLCVGYVNIGMVLDMGSSYLLPRIVGIRKAAELALFGDRIDGTEAERLGLVNRMVPDDQLLDTASRWASRLAAGPAVSIGAIKLGLRRASHGTFRDALHWESMMISLIAQTEDAAEGVSAFIEKRNPEYRGR